MSEKVYARITEQIVEKLEAGTVPWRKPWKSGPESLPVNLVSRKRYRGINVFLLALQPFNSNYWVSYKQAKLLGGNVRMGEKGTPVLFWKWHEIEDKAKGPIPVVRYYTVFNVEQTEGVEYPKPDTSPCKVKPIEAAEEIVRGYQPRGPLVRSRGNQACYIPAEDVVYMPVAAAFEKTEEFYSTLFHEMTHSTGHEKRLHRQTLLEGCPFGSATYSKEELVAEFGGAMLCGEAGISNVTIDNSASYIAGWLKKLRNDRRLIVVAAAQAQRAVDFILDRKFEDESETADLEPVAV